MVVTPVEPVKAIQVPNTSKPLGLDALRIARAAVPNSK